MDLRDGSAAAPVRASFDNIGLFDLCPGPTGDAAIQPAGVMGGPLLANFSVGFVFPRGLDLAATMTLWPGFGKANGKRFADYPDASGQRGTAVAVQSAV